MARGSLSPSVVEYRNHVGRIVIRDAQTGDRIKRIPARVSGDVGDAAWSPDGRRIVFGAYSADPDDWNKVLTIRPNGTGKRVAFTMRPNGTGKRTAFAVSVRSDFSLIGGLAWYRTAQAAHHRLKQTMAFPGLIGGLAWQPRP